MARNTRKLRCISGGIALCVAMAANSVLAQDVPTAQPAGGIITSYDVADYDLLPPTETFHFNSNDKFYHKHKFSDDLRIKGIEIGEGIYFGDARVAGNRGPGIVVERGDLFWGVNHRGAEVLLRF